MRNSEINLSNSINCKGMAWESADYFVLQTLLYRDLSNLSDLVKDSMNNIALACVGELGQAVYEARAIVDTMIIGSSCPPPSSGHRKGKTESDTKWKLSPNPNQNGLTQLTGRGFNENLEIEAFNMSGIRVLYKLINNYSEPLWLDLSNQPNGIYFLNLRTASNFTTLKFVKQ